MSSARPGQWELLGSDGDPLPGDVHAVHTEARHYSDTASQIREQVSRLRKIAAGDNELVGKYAPALADSAGDLADHLDDAQGRFDTVATQLGRWAPALDRGRSESGSLLREAEAAQSSIDANQPPSNPVDQEDDAAVAADKRRGDRLSDAKGDLSSARSRFHDLMEAEPDGVRVIARDVADKINNSSDDDLKDSWWDSHVRAWIHDHADLLKAIADVLTWVATAIVIAIVVLGTGGLGLAMLLTAGALLIHTVLAANGDGSWVDVGLDAFALVTMGAGKILSSAAKGAYALDEGTVAFSRASSEARSAFSAADGLFGKAGAWITRSNPVMRNVIGFTAGKGRYLEVMAQDFKGGRMIDLITMGDRESAGLYQAVTKAIDLRGPSFLLNSSHEMLNAMRPVFLSGVGVDFTAKMLNPAVPLGNGQYLKPPLTGFSDWAEQHTVRHGGYW